MLKAYDKAVTLAEFPDEIAICLNISNCPNHCSHCSEPWLLGDRGAELTENRLQRIIDNYSDCTVFGLMGGDSDHEDVKRIANYIHEHSNMKVGMYSGRDYIDLDLVPYLDIYKIGRWIKPEGSEEDMKTKCWGPLVWPNSNQLYFEKIDGKLVNTTDKFRKNKISDYTRYIL